MPLKAPDLTKQPPRSPRVRLGGYVHLPRLLDKCRAALAGTNGEYNYDCPLDQTFFSFAGVDAKALKRQVATGKGDGEVLAWLQKHQKPHRGPAEVAAWSAFQEQLAPATPDLREFFNEVHQKIGPQREDIRTWFDLLDLDDYVSFGGQA